MTKATEKNRRPFIILAVAGACAVVIFLAIISAFAIQKSYSVTVKADSINTKITIQNISSSPLRIRKLGQVAAWLSITDASGKPLPVNDNIRKTPIVGDASFTIAPHATGILQFTLSHSFDLVPGEYKITPTPHISVASASIPNFMVGLFWLRGDTAPATLTIPPKH